MISTIIFALSTLALQAQASPQTDDRDRVPVGSAALVAEPPTIDGRLNDSAWNDAPVLRDFVQREPAEGEPVSESRSRNEPRFVSSMTSRRYTSARGCSSKTPPPSWLEKPVAMRRSTTPTPF